MYTKYTGCLTSLTALSSFLGCHLLDLLNVLVTNRQNVKSLTNSIELFMTSDLLNMLKPDYRGEYISRIVTNEIRKLRHKVRIADIMEKKRNGRKKYSNRDDRLECGVWYKILVPMVSDEYWDKE